jgi:hypothetical protein
MGLFQVRLSRRFHIACTLLTGTRRKMATVKSADDKTKTLRAVVYREGDLYVAQCLECDIAAQAADLDSVLDRLDLTIEAECALRRERNEKPFECFTPAPNYFHDLWDKASLKIARIKVPVGHHHPVLEVAFAKAA